MVTFTAEALKLAYSIQRKIESLEGKIQKQNAKLNKVLGGEIPIPVKGKNNMSAAGRARIAAAQKRRWAKMKSKGGSGRKMSAAAKKAISLAAKLRWKKAKAAGKNRL